MSSSPAYEIAWDEIQAEPMLKQARGKLMPQELRLIIAIAVGAGLSAGYQEGAKVALSTVFYEIGAAAPKEPPGPVVPPPETGLGGDP